MITSFSARFGTRGREGGKRRMTRHLRALTLTAAIGLLVALSAGPAALAQKQGGILRQYIIDSPASMSIHEETTVVAERPMMAVMNNLVLFDQHVPQNRAARHGHVPGLSVPCLAGADAPASNRHRPVQIRRIQAQRVHQGGEEPGLLEAGPTLSRRDRVHDIAQPLEIGR